MDRAALKDWTQILTPWAQALALVAGGIFAIHEYRAHAQEVKVQRAMDYLSRTNAEELVAARSDLSQREQKKADRIREILLDGSLSRDEKNKAYFDFVVQELIMYGKKDGLEVPFYHILGYLDEGVTCAKQGLCDESTIRAELSDFGQGFVTTYTPYFCYLRHVWNDPTIGKRVEEFYNPLAAKQACDSFYQSIQRISLKSGRQP